MNIERALNFLSEYDQQAAETDFHHQTMEGIHEDFEERLESFSEEQLQKLGMILVRQATMRSSMTVAIEQALVVKRK